MTDDCPIEQPCFENIMNKRNQTDNIGLCD